MLGDSIRINGYGTKVPKLRTKARGWIKMKKKLCLLLSLVMVTYFAYGCDHGNTEGSSTPNSVTESLEESDSSQSSNSGTAEEESSETSGTESESSEEENSEETDNEDSGWYDVEFPRPQE